VVLSCCTLRALPSQTGGPKIPEIRKTNDLVRQRRPVPGMEGAAFVNGLLCMYVAPSLLPFHASDKGWLGFQDLTNHTLSQVHTELERPLHPDSGTQRIHGTLLLQPLSFPTPALIGRQRFSGTSSSALTPHRTPRVGGSCSSEDLPVRWQFRRVLPGLAVGGSWRMKKKSFFWSGTLQVDPQPSVSVFSEPFTASPPCEELRLYCLPW